MHALHPLPSGLREGGSERFRRLTACSHLSRAAKKQEGKGRNEANRGAHGDERSLQRSPEAVKPSMVRRFSKARERAHGALVLVDVTTLGARLAAVLGVAVQITVTRDTRDHAAGAREARAFAVGARAAHTARAAVLRVAIEQGFAGVVRVAIAIGAALRAMRQAIGGLDGARFRLCARIRGVDG